jgi:hypothetical protein
MSVVIGSNPSVYLHCQLAQLHNLLIALGFAPQKGDGIYLAVALFTTFPQLGGSLGSVRV